MKVVDRALDAYVKAMRAKGVEPQGFKVATLAKLAGRSTPLMSQLLQQYRSSQRGGRSRYVIGCHQYGPRARWRILAKPGADTKSVQAARVLQAKWAARDAARRVMSDLVCEISPSLRGAPADALIDSSMTLIVAQFDALADHVDRVLNGSPT